MVMGVADFVGQFNWSRWSATLAHHTLPWSDQGDTSAAATDGSVLPGVASASFLAGYTPVAGGAAPAGTVVFIDPTAAAGGNGSQAKPYNNWSFGTLQAGTTYLQRAGTVFTGVIHDTTVGSAAAPVVIGAYGAGAAPVIDGSVDFSGASYAVFAGFHLTSLSYAAVIIQQGSTHIDVASNAITGSAQGIWIGNQAGGGNWVRDNTVVGSAGAGILVASTLSSQAAPTVISHNLVSGSGNDGIQVASDYITVSGNRLSGNGLQAPGSSGIHVFASSATSGGGQHDRIIGNVSVYNQDRQLQDGNGILLDQWTGHNVVSGNFAMGNDGAGIAVYDSTGNVIRDNVLTGNGLDPAHTHSIHADLVLNQVLGLTTHNAVLDNTVLSERADGEAVFVAAAPAQAANAFRGNVLENLAGPGIYDLAGTIGADLHVWNGNGAADQFSGVTISTPASGMAYAYAFSGQKALHLDGHLVHLTGWTPSGGLFGT
jgi:parallel beta-helix repeat protein